MIAPNTLSREEYAQRLSAACARMRKRIEIIKSEEERSMRIYEESDDDESALYHYFNYTALLMAKDALTKSPNQLLKQNDND